MKEERKLHVAIYCRVSTEDQAREGFSIDAQKDRLEGYIKSEGWTIQEYYIDAGYSGRNTKRPAYERMFANIGSWDGILCLKMDRIHRNSKNFLKMMDLLQKQGKEFISSMEKIDTSSAMGRFVMFVIQAIAQLESEQIGERVFSGLRQKAKTPEAGFQGHNVCYGYKWNAKDKKMLIVKEELETVKKCYALYNSGLSYKGIKKELGISDTNARYYLKNPIYAGFERWERFIKKANYIEAIVSIELFNRVQRLIHKRNRKNKDVAVLQLTGEDVQEIPRVKARLIPLVNRPKQHPI
jgi:DNA invertase Pin-like site-specific DNA recombinase